MCSYRTRTPFLPEMSYVSGRVSVVIPTYDRADLLPQAVESALAQSYPNVEIVVVDDGSTDGTAALLASWGERIRSLRLDRAGPSGARNAGIREATGEFVAFLDSDDVWMPDKLARQMEVFRAHPGTGMVGGGCRYIDAKGRPLPMEEAGPDVVTLEELQIFTALPGSASNVLVRRALLDEVGGFDEDLHRAEDRELWMRIAERAEVRCVPECTVAIRLHDGPRPNASFDLTVKARKEVNRRIRDPRARRRAEAWMWYNLGVRALRGSARLRGLGWILRSFLLHPRRLHPRLPRLRPLARSLLPRAVLGGLRKLRSGR